MSSLTPEQIDEINKLIAQQQMKIAAQEKQVAALVKRLETARSKEDYLNPHSHKHSAAKIKVNELRTELEIDRAALGRMKDKLEELGWKLTPEQDE